MKAHLIFFVEARELVEHLLISRQRCLHLVVEHRQVRHACESRVPGRGGDVVSVRVLAGRVNMHYARHGSTIY